jgi:hypothetical protein
MNIGRRRVAKHIPERYAANKNRCPLLDNGLVNHALPRQHFIKHAGYFDIDMRSVTRDTQITTDEYTSCWIECSVFGSREVMKGVSNERIAHSENSSVLNMKPPLKGVLDSHRLSDIISGYN